jgi:methylated-DNA-[protein]-cysteine S-methyltransferase
MGMINQMQQDLEARLRGHGDGALDQQLLERLAERARRNGLLDVAVAPTDTPIGPLLLAATDQGLVRVAFEGQDFDTVMEELAVRISPRVLEAPKRLDPVRRQLDEYFEGKRTTFELPVDMQLSHGFRHKALGFIASIPYGHTASYKDVARAAGSPAAVRAAGSACGSNPVPIVVPCHRVLRTGGGLGGYGGGLDRKEQLLRLEGALL